MKLKRIFIFAFSLTLLLTSNYFSKKVTAKEHYNFLKLTQKSKRMSYKEILEEMIKDGIDKEKAVKSLEESKLNKNLRINSWYTTIEDSIYVTDSYSVKVKFYIQAEGGHGVYFIRKVLNATLDRNYNGLSKGFSGELFYNLESKTSLYYLLNGDFYNNSNTIVSGGISIGLNESTKISFGVSNSSNHYKYIYKDGYINYGRY